MKLRSMDPYDEPAWWRWSAVVELRLIADDIVLAARRVRRIPWRMANAVYRRFPSWCPRCDSCGIRRETKMPLRFWSRLRPYGIVPLCNQCRAREMRAQAEAFNEMLDYYRRLHEDRST